MVTRQDTPEAVARPVATEQGAALSALPASTAPPAVAASPASPPSSAVREIRATVRELEAAYTVQPGDSLGAIAARFNTTVSRLQAINNLADPRILNVGQKLVVPPPL
ncbi:MAG: LysM peptidoglycan-binding domain-containing protein [Chloroflexi bacterium]|nr:LysM peptidoglycan-binding domain-containing protein [Chloroflexota bacterium]